MSPKSISIWKPAFEQRKLSKAQFLEIMKQAERFRSALEVQSQLADVRTEIERLEGRRRFLENQAALSTITTTLQMPAPIVAATTTGFGHSIKQAFGDAVDTAASIVLVRDPDGDRAGSDRVLLRLAGVAPLASPSPASY